MKIIFTWHALEEKIPLLKSLNWNITRAKIRQTIKKPKWRGTTKYGQSTAMSLEAISKPSSLRGRSVATDVAIYTNQDRHARYTRSR